MGTHFGVAGNGHGSVCTDSWTAGAARELGVGEGMSCRVVISSQLSGKR
jgi:hypothetical protein